MRSLTATEVLEEALERFHPRLATACSFQKEESVMLDMLLAIEPEARVFTIDTGVLFPETIETWRAFEERWGVKVEVFDARGEPPWTGGEHCCANGAKTAALEEALTGLDAWVTGLRREQAPTRVGVEPLEHDERRGIWKVNPLADWTDKDVWRYIARARPALQPAARPRLRLDRLRALHPARERPRGPLGRPGQARVRAARGSGA